MTSKYDRTRVKTALGPQEAQPGPSLSSLASVPLDAQAQVCPARGRSPN